MNELSQKALQMAWESLKIEKEAIEQAMEYLDKEEFIKVATALSECKKIITCASGSSGIAAKKFQHSLCCIDRPACFMSPAEAVHGGLGVVTDEDCVIMVSRGGKTVELLPIIDVVKKKGAKLIAVTENLNSPLADNADFIIKMQIEKESDKYNMMATASYVATIAIFDALLAAVMELTGYKKEQFGLIHPGGAVGERLNKK
ncbi:MAG: SIS domain-containing protein [Clostridia bacterium]|nr:SIS domain-containing protein [Clostridia bacterium]